MRRAALLFFSIFLSLGLLSRQSFSAEATKVIIGVDAPTLSDLPLSVALKKDFFKSEGLTSWRCFSGAARRPCRLSCRDRSNLAPASARAFAPRWPARRLKASLDSTASRLLSFMDEESPVFARWPTSRGKRSPLPALAAL